MRKIKVFRKFEKPVLYHSSFRKLDFNCFNLKNKKFLSTTNSLMNINSSSFFFPHIHQNKLKKNQDLPKNLKHKHYFHTTNPTKMSLIDKYWNNTKERNKVFF